MKKHYDFFSQVLKHIAVVIFLLSLSFVGFAQDHSVARQWNEVLLEGIRHDFARPTVHARNLWHSSVVMYDTWAAYDPVAEPYFLARTVGDFYCEFEGVPQPDDVQAAQEEAMSFAMCRLLKHRFSDSPGWIPSETYAGTNVLIDALMAELGYDESNTSTDYIGGTPAEFGNYIAEQMIAFGFQDGSNEQNSYANEYYNPVNNDIYVELPGNADMSDPNRWQPITVSLFIDQSGNPLPGSPPFLSPEWGNVVGFTTDDSLKTTYNRDGFDYHVYYDPGAPPYIDTLQQQGLENMYKWGHTMVSVWQSHNDPTDGVMWDISPGAIGGLTPDDYPTTFEEMPDFYDYFNGGDNSPGHPINPVTGLPYEPQVVARGDYARVLAEFWADGPESETPPGHWFTILNYVSDHPMLEKRWNGEGEIIDDLSWDVRSYFVLGSAMHDAAIAAWSIKGWYDYARPVSAIRFMAEKGQSSDDQLPNYHPGGIPLVPGYIELVMPGDPLAGVQNINLYKIKVNTWKGPAYIDDPATDDAGVGWILAEYWWPYQRPSFVTPPFAGFVSGHSTYSRAAAEVMTLITGDEYFPGGMGVFDAPQNDFLVFEQGPSMDIELQWATYRDASDQCSLSRIWGGIHPPADDFPGRRIGMKVGPYAYNHAMEFMEANQPRVTSLLMSDILITDVDAGNSLTLTIDYDRAMDSEYSPIISFPLDDPSQNSLTFSSAQWIDSDTFEAVYLIADANEDLPNSYVQISGALDLGGQPQTIFLSGGPIVLDTRNPVVSSLAPQVALINDNVTALGTYVFTINFDEAMDMGTAPQVSFPVEDPSSSLSLNAGASFWDGESTFVAVFDITDANVELDDIDIAAVGALDQNGNVQELDYSDADAFSIDTRNPVNTGVIPSEVALADAEVGLSLIITFTFDEAMNTAVEPTIAFPDGDPLVNSLTPNDGSTFWVNNTTYRAVYLLNDANEELIDMDIATASAVDLAGNFQTGTYEADVLSIDTKNPSVTSFIPENSTIFDGNVGVEGFQLEIVFDEAMNSSDVPSLVYSLVDPLANTLSFNAGASSWQNPTTYVAVYDVLDANEELGFANLTVADASDSFGNPQIVDAETAVFNIDTKNPEVLVISANTYNVNSQFVGEEEFNLLMIFDEAMNQDDTPVVVFPVEDPLAEILTPNNTASSWINSSTYKAVFDVAGVPDYTLLDIDVSLMDFTDVAGNEYVTAYYSDYFDIQITTVGIDVIDGFSGLVVYPNPIGEGGTLNVDFGESVNSLNYQVFNSTGQLIASERISNFSGQYTQISTSEWSSGIYFVKLQSESKSASLRVQKIK